jgi:hypothetical protein
VPVTHSSQSTGRGTTYPRRPRLETIGKYDRVHGARARAADRLDADATIFQQAIEHALR